MSQHKEYGSRKGPYYSSRLWFVIPLLAICALFLYLEQLTQYEFLSNVATIPLEIMAGAVLVEGYMARKEQEKRARQLMFIKSFIFRSELRTLYLINFAALEEPAITMSMIRRADLARLKQMRDSAGTTRYRSLEAMEPVIMEYVDAYSVFYGFMEWAIANDSDRILAEMVFVLHFIQDVKLFEQHHPDGMFIHHAEQHPHLKAKVMRLLGTGVVKFLDYVIELKINQPTTFDDLLADYEASSLAPPGSPHQRLFFDKGRTVFHALMRDS